MAEGKVGSEGPKQGREGVLHVINPRLEHALLPFVGFFPLFVSQLTPEFFTCCCRGAICSCSLMLAASPCFNRGAAGPAVSPGCGFVFRVALQRACFGFVSVWVEVMLPV